MMRMKKMMRRGARLLLLAMALPLFAGGAQAARKASPAFDASKAIRVVSREDGSGTRGAFAELFGVEVRAGGGRKDMTTKEAIVANQTGVVLTKVAGDLYAIGYISLGSLNGTVKALRIEGAAASAENVKNGSYPIARPFNIATRGEPAGAAKDFIAFILSAEGQAVVARSCVPIAGEAPPYAGGRPSGRIVVAGSSSVAPVMEKLKEAYARVNPGAVVEIQESDSSAGMTAAASGTCDIGMASRELKESELARLTPTRIALDGIAVIVNNGNPLTELTKEQVRSVYTGETARWSEAGR